MAADDQIEELRDIYDDGQNFIDTDFVKSRLAQDKETFLEIGVSNCVENNSLPGCFHFCQDGRGRNFI